jgi:hypothetical protein
LIALAEEERIGADHEHAGSLLDESRKDALDVAFAAGS